MTMNNRAIDKYLNKHSFKDFKPKAVLFDMDGVLYDSMPNHAKAWKECMKKFGLTMTEEEAYQYEGMRGVETIRIIAGKQLNKVVSDEEAAYIYKEKSAIYSSFDTAPMINGVYELQQSIKRRGWTIGIVTGSGQTSLLDRILHDFAGLVNPEVMVSAKDVTKGKPCPDPYIKGMAKAGVQSWETIVIENAPLGVRAAVAARCFTIAVNTGPLPDSILADEGADLVLPTMKDAIEFLSKTFPDDGESPSCL